jgi:tetratricopeptide (TPR) repeat protein
MRTVLGLWVVLLSAGPARADAEEHFASGMKALAAKNYTTALAELEAALTAEPDSIRYGSEYRQAVIEAREYDRCIKFFEKLVAGNPKASNAHLNYGFAYVDKIPAAGSITQVILANTALSHFTKSIELQPSWIAYYTRGNSYLYWPKIFGRASLGVADLEQAMKIQSQDKKRSYHVRVYISLGDGYWKMDDLERARKTWEEGLANFPEDAQLKARLSREGDELKKYIDDVLDPNKRVNTNLQELWSDQ